MPIEIVREIEDPQLAEYRWVANPDTLVRHGRFVAEGRFIVKRLLESARFRARSLLMTPEVWENFGTTLDASLLAATRCYVIPREALQTLTGIEFHRGCLAIGERRNADAASEFRSMLARKVACLVVLEDIINPDNMGGIFRNAQAFGAAAILLSPRCVDPLYRKAVRVSMGAALQVPFFRIEDWSKVFELLAENRFCSIALTPHSGAIPLAHVAKHFDASAQEITPPDQATRKRDKPHPTDGNSALRNARSAHTAFVHGLPKRVALFFGSEGKGLSDTVLRHAHLSVQIPICAEVDSLNVATASGIALHHFQTLFFPEATDAIS